MEKFISDKKFMDTLNEYHNIKNRRNIKLHMELGIDDDGVNKTPRLEIFADSYINGKLISIPLNNEEIIEPLRAYTKNLGHELDSFKYVGGVIRTGYHVDNDRPCFLGVMLKFKDKVKVKKK